MSSLYPGDPSPANQKFSYQGTSYQEPSSPELPSQQPSSPQPASQRFRYHQPPFFGWIIQPVVVHPQVNEKAIASLVLGLCFALISFALIVWRSAVFFTLPLFLVLGLGVYPLVVGIPAVILGHIALIQINNSNGMQRGHWMAGAGMTLGYLAIAAVVFAVTFVIFRPELLPAP